MRLSAASKTMLSLLVFAVAMVPSLLLPQAAMAADKCPAVGIDGPRVRDIGYLVVEGRGHARCDEKAMRTLNVVLIVANTGRIRDQAIIRGKQRHYDGRVLTRCSPGTTYKMLMEFEKADGNVVSRESGTGGPFC